ncbi:FKBP-type peptidyl-prolyl cis-trans isomerase, partial [Citrobacter freundii]|uniref:FKBP-type peptidyl-prolyl cis-trans isomerase n=1 Tax=Citrobacter freundii TaxID=546 RepID=UPI001CD37AF8
ADRNRSHWSTSKTPSYTKSVSWQHHQEFDNSYTRGEPLSFRLDGVIPGWTEGLKNIKKGGKIQLVIPPDLAYGKTGVPGIPANSTLVFDVELLDIKPAPKADAQPDAAPADKAADSSKK